MSGLPVSRLAILAPIVLFACASATPTRPDGYVSGDPVSVTYHQALDDRPSLQLGLLNRSHSAAPGFASTLRSEASLKLISDEEMDSLLAALNGTGFFEHAQPWPEELGNLPDGALWTLVLDGPRGRLGVAFRREGADGDQARRRMEDLSDAKAVFHYVYSSAFSFQAVENPEGADYFRRAEEKKGTRVVEGGDLP